MATETKQSRRRDRFFHHPESDRARDFLSKIRAH